MDLLSRSGAELRRWCVQIVFWKVSEARSSEARLSGHLKSLETVHRAEASRLHCTDTLLARGDLRSIRSIPHRQGNSERNWTVSVAAFCVLSSTLPTLNTRNGQSGSPEATMRGDAAPKPMRASCCSFCCCCWGETRRRGGDRWRCTIGPAGERRAKGPIATGAHSSRA